MDFFKEILKFFTDKEYSFASKFIGFLVIVLLLFCIDNILGFSFYYSNNQKITQLKNIESLKRDCVENKSLIVILNGVEKKIVGRKNIFENFIGLFSGEPFDEGIKISKTFPDTVYITKRDTVILRVGSNGSPKYIWGLDSLLQINSNKTGPQQTTDKGKSAYHLDSLSKAGLDSNKLRISKKESRPNSNELKSRSKLWHTISSSYLFILLLIILPFIPFSQNKIDWNLFVGILIFIVIDIGLIWLSQFLLGLIPVILNRPWINYVLNFCLHGTFWIGIVTMSKKKKN